MPKLILSLDDTFLGEYPVDKKYVTIGRRPTNDIQIDNLAVSGDHARIIHVDGTAFLEDLNSTNGSTLNGVPTSKHVLQHGDVIGISKYQLTYVDEAAIGAPGKSQLQDFENTILVQPAADMARMAQESVPAQEARQAETAPPADLPPPACVQVLNGPAKGRELPLSKALTTLGKPGEQVAVISRRHNGYYITHVEGREQPSVNGTAIGAQAHRLCDHDVIELAGVKMEFYLTGA